MTLLSTKTEYMALTKTIQETLWLKKILRELKLLKKLTKIFLFNDNLGVIVLIKNFEYKSKTKHMEIKWHWIKKTY